MYCVHRSLFLSFRPITLAAFSFLNFLNSLYCMGKPGSLDVRANHIWKESRQDYRKLRKALCVGYANQLAERMIHHNGYRTLGFKPQLVQVFV